jgi:RNA polymerase sigma factor (sigma-70 family)
MTAAAQYIRDALLECYLADALEPKAKARLEASISISPEAQTRLAELRAASAAFLQHHQPNSLKAPVVMLDQLDVLYQRFAPAINRRIRAILREADEAWDVMRETFFAYMRTDASLRGEASPFPVLYQMAIDKAFDRLRRNSRRFGVFDSFNEQQLVAWDAAHDGGLARLDALQELAIITEGETPQSLTVAVLFFVEGYTIAEVAEVLNLSRRVISDLLRKFSERARQKIARHGARVSPSTRRITDALLEHYIADELEPEEKARLEAILAASPMDQARLAELRADSAAILLRHPAGPLIARILDDSQGEH